MTALTRSDSRARPTAIPSEKACPIAARYQRFRSLNEPDPFFFGALDQSKSSETLLKQDIFHKPRGGRGPRYRLLSMLRAHIDVAMDGPRDRNIFGAFALMISDDIVRASSSRAPEAGPAASALALLAHKPGLSIRMLAIGVGLSHAGTVRLVDRLVSEGLIERREHSTDGRARSLYLTPTGKVASDEVLASRDQVIAEGLSILNPDELKTLSDIAERVLRNRLENLEQSYRICRLCCYEGCTNCPVDAELHERGVDREKNDDA